MSNSEGVETNTVVLEEERRQASHQEVKSSIDDDVNARIKREPARVEPKESAEVTGAANKLKQKSVREAVGTERELERGRVAARISQVVDYIQWRVSLSRAPQGDCVRLPRWAQADPSRGKEQCE